jgi:hypothetical protein
MNLDANTPPRVFSVGAQQQIQIKDCGKLLLDADEQVTLVTESGGEYDVTRKDWGFYATPSLNGRLPSFGLKAVLNKNRGTGRYFVFLLENGKEASFQAYLDVENLAVVCWLDNNADLAKLEQAIAQS